MSHDFDHHDHDDRFHVHNDGSGGCMGLIAIVLIVLMLVGYWAQSVYGYWLGGGRQQQLAGIATETAIAQNWEPFLTISKVGSNPLITKSGSQWLAHCAVRLNNPTMHTLYVHWSIQADWNYTLATGGNDVGSTSVSDPTYDQTNGGYSGVWVPVPQHGSILLASQFLLYDDSAPPTRDNGAHFAHADTFHVQVTVGGEGVSMAQDYALIPSVVGLTPQVTIDSCDFGA